MIFAFRPVMELFKRVVLLAMLVTVEATATTRYVAFPPDRNGKNAKLKYCAIEFNEIRVYDHTDLLLGIFESLPSQLHGDWRDEHKYEVRPVGVLNNVAYDFVTLKPRAKYVSHEHYRARGFFRFLKGRGYVIVGNQKIPYGPGVEVEVPSGVPHGFKTISETVFVSLNSPPILDRDTGEVDIHFDYSQEKQ